LAKTKKYTLRLTVLGKTKTVQWLKVVELPRPARGTRIVNCGPSSYCEAKFPALDEYGLAALQVAAVEENASCPVPGLCYQLPGHGLDLVTLDMVTGPSGMNHTGMGQESLNLSLILTNGTKACMDSITYNAEVEYALGGLGPEGPPRTAFIALVWFDVPTGFGWTSVNFTYTSGSTYRIYVFPNYGLAEAEDSSGLRTAGTNADREACF
jgi:hypothetical protein